MGLWRRFSSVEWMLLSIWIIGFACYATQPLADPDTPWHLATGSYILMHGHVPTVDPFSWSMRGRPWVTQEWLFDAALAWSAGHLRFVGIWLFVVIIHTCTVIVLYLTAYRVSAGNRVVAALVACLGTLVGLPFWIVRPQLLSYLLFAVFLWILQMVREERLWAIWLIPPLIWFWANVHGTATIGIAMVLFEVVLSYLPSVGRVEGFRLSNRVRIRLAFSAAVGFLLGLVNPNGIRAYTYALLSTNPVMTNNILEWHSPDFHVAYYQYGVLAFFALCFGALLIRRGVLPLRELIYFLGFIALALVHQRFMPYVAICAVPLLAVLLQDKLVHLARPSRFMRWFNSLMTAVACGIFVWLAPSLGGAVSAHFDNTTYPIDAVNFMQQHHYSGRLLNAYRYGGYLVYRGIPTFVDGRTDIFIQNSTFEDYLALKNVWWNCPDLLDSYHFKVALFPLGYPILTYLQNDPQWHVVYRDLVAEVVVKR